MFSSKLRLCLSFICVLRLAWTPLGARSEEPKLLVGTGAGVASECGKVTNSMVAGCRAILNCSIINLQAYPDVVFDIFSEESWKRVSVEAGHLANSEFVPDRKLLRLLDLTRRITWLDRYGDSVRRAEGKPLQQIEAGQIGSSFIFTAPEEYTNQRVYFRVTYSDPRLGVLRNHISADSSIFVESAFITIVSPCNDKDRQAAQGTYVWEANQAGLHQRALQIADSLIALGWHDVAGLQWAEQSAMFLNRPADQLRYLELNFETNGKITTERATPEEQARVYQENRRYLLDEIRKEQQH
jgi:hypothetical protein